MLWPVQNIYNLQNICLCTTIYKASAIQMKRWIKSWGARLLALTAPFWGTGRGRSETLHINSPRPFSMTELSTLPPLFHNMGRSFL
jgi:hypothetical protein